ncbi:hypothetical protein bcCo53_001698 (plasmid) [Borrelia coriaceae]|uniref:Fibronectin-binding lipoprotein n=3 Tax=Borrelia coriaceae TaxID=144 RepID=W5SY82_9SPIR|nr:hypothetical protein [Borrelia coriaceae]AHH11827.1 Fibronectin-binding lipoprotein [Borrelia coriaceae ATCC 43381]UPA17493.1 hypothetical protein bcCo53_001698 [Borrelia coriaceae]
MFKLKYFCLGLILCLISCDLILNGNENTSAKLLKKAYSILEPTQKNNPSNNTLQDNIINFNTSPIINEKSTPQAINQITDNNNQNTNNGNNHITTKDQNTNKDSIKTLNSPIITNIKPHTNEDNKNTQTINTLTQSELNTKITENPTPTNTDDTIISNSHTNTPPTILSGTTNNLNSISGESSINYEYNNYIPSTTKSGSYSGPMTTIEDDEEDNDDDYEDDEEDNDYDEIEKNHQEIDNEDEDEDEAQLNREYKSRLIKTKNSVKNALKLAKKINKHWETIKFNEIKINPIYGKKPEESEKQKSQDILHKFTKNKLTKKLTKLSNAIQESLSDAIHLTTNDFGYPGNLQKDQKAKTKLDTIKTEVNILLSKVQKSHHNDYKVYEELSSLRGILPPSTKSELKEVLRLLYGTTGAR